MKVGWVGLFQNWQRGWCGWRRVSEGRIIGDAASTVERLWELVEGFEQRRDLT